MCTGFSEYQHKDTEINGFGADSCYQVINGSTRAALKPVSSERVSQ